MSPNGMLPWRVTTALRTFMLALVTGMILSNGEMSRSLPGLAALVLVAATCATLEWGVLRRTMWVPLAEGVATATLLSVVPTASGMLAYLAVPPLIAGVRQGWVTTVNASALAAVTLVLFLLQPGDPGLPRLTAAAPWLLFGLAAGLLASWQSRSVRDLEARQAPYAAAHQLMVRLHQLARSGALGLDSSVVASQLASAARAEAHAHSSLVSVAEADVPLDVVATPDERVRLLDAVDAHRNGGNPPGDIQVLPLRGSTGIFGWIALAGAHGNRPETTVRLQGRADEFALQLDTAMIFDRVRALATAEERHRIAREMHDGVAQELVALGYVVDEIESVSREEDVQRLAASLRAEISRVVTELRLSIFDLRHPVDHLPTALADYVRSVSHDAGLRPHLLLDESGPSLPPRAQTQLLRIAQEAIVNVRRHAHAENLWVTLVTHGDHVLLEIQDDGVGNAAVKDRHWGLQTMRERAESLAADLHVLPRPGGGTTIRVQSRPTTTPEGSAPRAHHSPARR